MAEGGLDEYESWRCSRQPQGEKWYCPPEGCPLSYGCARLKGWQPGMESPPECRGVQTLQSRKDEENLKANKPAV